MKHIFLGLILFSTSIQAGLSANVSFASDYIWRGMTQTDGSALQGGFDFKSESGFYLGMWGSNVNFNNGNGQELDRYMGYSFTQGPIGVDLGYIIYEYPDSNPNLEFEETYLGLNILEFGVTYAKGKDFAPNYLEYSYNRGNFRFAYGKYDNFGNNSTASYDLLCGSFTCSIGFYKFSDKEYNQDDDGLFLSISATL